MKMMHGAAVGGLLKHVANAGGTDADIHLDKIASRQTEERHARFAGDRFGQATSCPFPEVRPATRPWESARRVHWYFSLFLRKSTTSRTSSTASSIPAASSNVIARSSWPYSLPRLRENDIGEPTPPIRRSITTPRNTRMPIINSSGQWSWNNRLGRALSQVTPEASR